MEEVAGDAALLVDPGDVAGLADALDLVLGRPGRRRVVSSDAVGGFDIAAAHTWEASAARHVEAYRFAPPGGRRSTGRDDPLGPPQPVG